MCVHCFFRSYKKCLKVKNNLFHFKVPYLREITLQLLRHSVEGWREFKESVNEIPSGEYKKSGGEMNRRTVMSIK